jgi:hypothetical protein
VSTDADMRASGLPADQEAVREIAAENEQPAVAELPEERARSFRFQGFSRMRTDWYGDDGMVMVRVKAMVNNILDNAFEDLLAIRFELYDLVRTTIGHDEYGLPIWEKSATGNYVEDWTRLGNGEQKRFLFQITTRMFDWERTRDELWAESMFAKTQWEEAFSTGWEECEIGKRTEGDRTAAGRLKSQEERYFAIFRTYLSRRSDSLVSGMERLSQRIKDVHTA